MNFIPFFQYLNKSFGKGFFVDGVIRRRNFRVFIKIEIIDKFHVIINKEC